MKLKNLLAAVFSLLCLQASAQTMPALCAEHLRVAYICAADLDAATIKMGLENQNMVGAVQMLEEEIFTSVRDYGDRKQELLDRACMPDAFLHAALVKTIVKLKIGLTVTKEASERCDSGVETLKAL